MIEIPPEIWIHIASFLPYETLRDLYSVDSVFLDASMNARWKEVVLKTRDVDEGTHIFERLSDPFIARRVRKLILLCRQRSEKNVPHPLNSNSAVTFDSRKISFSCLDSARYLIRKAMETGPRLANVDHLSIISSELPPTYYLRPLCKICWMFLGTNLRCLTLGGNVGSYLAIIESSPNLPALSELRLDFKDDGDVPQSSDDADTLQEENDIGITRLTTFVNSLSPHLEGLRIWSWPTDLDISSFFSGLTVFPKLQYLGLRTSFNSCLHDASGLKDVLWNHSETLTRIELRLNPSRFYLDIDPEDPLRYWLLQCLADERCFSHVRFLDIYPTTQEKATEVILTIIRRVSRTVIRLTLRDRYLLLEEAFSVIDAVSECAQLKYLRMNVSYFNMELMDYMAAKLLNLEVLWICIGDYVDAHDDDHISSELEFTEALKTRSYERWRLKKLKLWQNDAEVGIDVMSSLATSIPSLEKSFDG